MFQLNDDLPPNFSPLASTSTFGHTGFTGTCAWADPDDDIIYIFLSNRTYPSMRNYQLSKKAFRQRTHSLVYQAETGMEKENLELGKQAKGGTIIGAGQ